MLKADRMLTVILRSKDAEIGAQRSAPFFVISVVFITYGLIYLCETERNSSKASQ